MAPLLLLAACPAPSRPSPPAEQPRDGTADSGEGDTGADDSGPSVDCEGTLNLVLEATSFAPGSATEVRAEGLEGASLSWEVSSGTVSADTGTSFTWSFGTELAVHVAEEASVTVRATEEGCEDQEATATVEVDWPEADRVVVLYNPNVEGSEAVARYYADFRGINATCATPALDSTTLTAAETDAFLDTVQACIDAVGEHVHYLVPVYGVPYKVADRIHDYAYTDLYATVSLDALLVFGAASKAFTQPAENQVYRRGDSMAADYNPYKPFGEVRERIGYAYYLVTRIDGAHAQAAMDLVDRTALAEQTELDGIVYVDGNRGDTPPTTDDFGSYEYGEWNMWGTRTVFEDFGRYEVVWDGNVEEFGTAPAPTECPDALYYAGWYQYYHYNDAFTWTTGAIGGHLDSCSACDLRADTWSAEALKRGITATFGAVNEPYVAGMPEYDQFFLYLTQGANYGEAAYESTRVALWMMVFVGDPLYRPYPG